MSVGEAPRGDSHLVAAVGDGSVESFETLYERYIHRAYRVAFSVCHDDGRAQEAVQEAFLSVWQASASFTPQRGSVAAWLLTIVRHRAIDIVRRNGSTGRRTVEERPQTLPAEGPACDVALRREADHELYASLAQLPTAQREVIMLAFFGQLSHSEIAELLDLAPGTVKGRMRLGLGKLRVTVQRP
jgi:RNA polymerase sigma-70 factor (ECF subfamily)